MCTACDRAGYSAVCMCVSTEHNSFALILANAFVDQPIHSLITTASKADRELLHQSQQMVSDAVRPRVPQTLL